MHGPGRRFREFATLALGILFTLLVFAGCSSPPQPAGIPAPSAAPSSLGTGLSWMDLPLTDLQGRGTFTVGSLSERPELVTIVSESCPSCVILSERQLNEMNGLRGVRLGVVSVVALDLDPGPGPGFVEAHRDAINFTGYTARAPERLSLMLLQELGPFAVDTTQVPVLLVCPGRKVVLLPPGVKTTDTLDTAIIREC